MAGAITVNIIMATVVMATTEGTKHLKSEHVAGIVIVPATCY
jgi:hypothetical protein